MATDGTATRFKNVFVLSTGRCGSQTFVRACEHFTNYSAGHETRSRELGITRLNYPASHIESDNRLSWLLGRLEQRFGEGAFYVHLKRDPAKVAESYDLRWSHRFSIIDAYNRSILMQGDYNVGAATDMVDTITTNIELFTKDKPHVIEIDIDAPQEGFLRFAQLIGAEGDIDAALSEFDVHHNARVAVASTTTTSKLLRPWELTKAYELLQVEYDKLKIDTSSAILAEREKRIKVQRSRKKLKEKVRFLSFTLGILAIPMLLILAPLWLPIVIVKELRRKNRRKSAKRQEQMIQSVCAAFHLRETEGPEAAVDLLRNSSVGSADGAIGLFRAMDADSDEVWASFMNTWARSHNLPKVELRPNLGTRFERITFPEVAKVNSPDLVTVIMPCFDAESSVTQAVQSILNQSWQNLEVIAVNDASSDGTGAVLEKIAQGDDRVRVLHNSVNVGPYVSKNRALQLAQGKFVTGHDSDDVALPDRIQRQIASLKAHKDAKATIGFMVRLDSSGAFDAPVKSPSRTYDGMVRLCPISMMCESTTLREVLGGWDSVKFGADSELIERMEKVLGDKFVRSKRVLMLCLSGENSLTNDPHTGTGKTGGLSPIRKAYIRSYRAWHQLAPNGTLVMRFPHDPRHFDAPEKMVVPSEDIRRLISHD